MLRKVFAEQPFSHHIEAELVRCGAGYAELAINVSDYHLQSYGFVAGGVLSYLADNAITFAGGLALRGDAVTSEFKINYVRPAQGRRVVARAETKGVGRRQAVCVCELFMIGDGDEQLCALAQGTVLSTANSSPDK